MSSVSGLIVLAGGAGTGSLLDSGLSPAAPWLVLAAGTVVSVALPGRRGQSPRQGRTLGHQPGTARR